MLLQKESIWKAHLYNKFSDTALKTQIRLIMMMGIKWIENQHPIIHKPINLKL